MFDLQRYSIPEINSINYYFFLSLQAQRAKFFKLYNLIGAGYLFNKICLNALFYIFVCIDVMNLGLLISGV